MTKSRFCSIFAVLMLSAVVISASAAERATIRLVLLPDTQFYSHPTEDNVGIFLSQTEWIVKNADSIDFVIHLGDITRNGQPMYWENVLPAFEVMDKAGVPYTFAAGNHDTGETGKSETRNTDNLNKYMPYAKYSVHPCFGGAFEQGRVDNMYHLFEAGGYKFIVFATEFGPRDKVLDWINEVVAQYPDRNVIVGTHGYMYYDDLRMGAGEDHKWCPQFYGLGKGVSGGEYANNGEEMWQKSISLHPNMLMVVNGHVLGDGTGRLVSEGVNGNKVYQMLSNYQWPIKGYNKGDGFLRIIDIDPSKRTMEVRSYSPYLDKYLTEPDQQFGYDDVELVKSKDM